MLRWTALLGLALLTLPLAAARAETTPPPLELVVLGSGGPGALGRAASCNMVLVDGVPRILVDTGPGCFVRLGKSGLSLDTVGIILLTHLHADHAGDLPGLVKSRAVSGGGPATFAIFGPTGRHADHDGAYFPSTSRFVALLFGAKGAFAYLPDFSQPITFKVTDLPAAPRPQQKPRAIFAKDGLTISAIAGHSRNSPAIIYRIDHGGKSLTFSGNIDPTGLPESRTHRGRDVAPDLQRRRARPARVPAAALCAAHRARCHRPSSGRGQGPGHAADPSVAADGQPSR